MALCSGFAPSGLQLQHVLLRKFGGLCATEPNCSFCSKALGFRESNCDLWSRGIVGSR